MLGLVMKSHVLFLPNLSLPKTRYRRQSAQQLLANKAKELKAKSFSQLGECLSSLIPKSLLQPSTSGHLSRIRYFCKANTFWAFFSQVLDADGGCKEVVRKFQASFASKSKSLPSSSTSAYCRARNKLDESDLASILTHVTQQLQGKVDVAQLQGRRVIVVDGTGLSMPDTAANEQAWPKQKYHKPGLGFPQASLCACFNLRNGALLSYELGNKKSHELPMLRKQWDTFAVGDIFLGDKGFCSYFDQYHLKERGVDSVITLARRKPVAAADALKTLGPNDLLIQWPKPKRNKASSYGADDWEKLPQSLPLRQIKVNVNQVGFRVESFYIITTLLDAAQYPAHEIAELYFQRWDVELFFRDIKSTMGMDILRCKTPAMVRKEIIMHLIVYNCVRALIMASTKEKNIAVRLVSFKGCVQTLRQWEPHLSQPDISKVECNRLMQCLFASIAGSTLHQRPGRNEPRAVKRRPKPHRLLTKARQDYKQ